ncbi:MAG: hypothetical protein E5V17_03220, partial [Mesorhizobium sp.]
MIQLTSQRQQPCQLPRANISDCGNITATEEDMARSIRVLYRGQHGTIRKNFNWDPINLDSTVVITAAEF